jgi:hypothetical protein
MPKIIFGRDNRIIGGQFRAGYKHSDYDEIDIEEIYEDKELYDICPFDTQEIWYIAGLKNPEVVSIDNSYTDPDSRWREEKIIEYRVRVKNDYQMFSKNQKTKD